jgi:DNA modification methylase
MAAREGREFIGFDIEAKYVDMANKRAKRELSTPKLF